MGASFGNGAVWINTKNTGAVERMFNIALGRHLTGAVTLRYGLGGTPLQPDGLLRTFEIHPAYQRVTFRIAGALDVCETTFLPLHDSGGALEPPLLYQLVEVHNRGAVDFDLRAVAHARLRGETANDVQAAFDERLQAIVAWNAGAPETVRVFGLEGDLTHYCTTFDFAAAYDSSHLSELNDSVAAGGDILGALQIDLKLAPGTSRRFAVKLLASAAGREAAGRTYHSAPTAPDALANTIAHLRDVLRASTVLTPDQLINEGALWSKVNMRRVMARFPSGNLFTNDPGTTSNVVVRDCAWFTYGNDHFMPEFSRAIFERLAAVQYASGKMPEYLDAVSGRVEDDGLNINDDTPLFVLAVNHHYRSSGDRAWLETIYPAVAKAARYILSQRDDRGLVYCSAHDPRGNVWAIASWRNIIPNYSINGAVTEINAECAAALRAAGHLTENLGGSKADAREFFAAAKGIRAAMDAHLRNPGNGLYYLNIDVDGNVHTDVTADELFPVIFRVCDDETGFRIISRLNEPDFWTPAGLRTASRDDPMYDPSQSAGLLGGVWPGVTWWYAFAAAAYHPGFMVRALRSSFEHYAADPRTNNTVPGQFSEWFDGESLTNKGMRLSPWEPPRFLWAAVEGVCGLMLTPGLPRIHPLIPQDWNWVGLRRLRYHGGDLSYFAVKIDGALHLYATGDIDTKHRKHLYARDVTEKVRIFGDGAVVIALEREHGLAIMVGNTASQTVTFPLDVSEALPAGARYTLRVFSSERNAWDDRGEATSQIRGPFAVSVETAGFRLAEFERLA